MVKKIIFSIFVLCSLNSFSETRDIYVSPGCVVTVPSPYYLSGGTHYPKQLSVYYIGPNGEGPQHDSIGGASFVVGGELRIYWEVLKIYIHVTKPPGEVMTATVQGDPPPPPPPPQTYDFSDQNFEYSSTKDQLAVLQYQDPATGEWKDAAARFIRGKASITDPNFSFGFGAYDLPPGIENWNIKYSDIIDNSEGWQNTPHSSVWRGEVSEDDPTYTSTPVDTVLIENPNVSSVTTSPSTNTTSSVPTGTIADQAGISNLSPSNTVESSAVGVAGGIKLAKGEISKAVKEGVSGLKSDLSGKADQIVSAINNIDVGGSGATAGEIQNIVDGVGANETLESTAIESDFNSVSTNINSSAGHEAVDRMEGKLDTFLNDYQKPIFPQGFGSINSLSFTIFDSPVNLNFDQPMWVTLRAFLVWLVYALSFFGLLKILRRGIA